MAEVRHISYRAEDVDAMAKFFVDYGHDGGLEAEGQRHRQD
jgi:hypothetical protein